MNLTAAELASIKLIIDGLDKLQEVYGIHISPNTTAWFTAYSENGERFSVEIGHQKSSDEEHSWHMLVSVLPS